MIYEFIGMSHLNSIKHDKHCKKCKLVNCQHKTALDNFATIANDAYHLLVTGKVFGKGVILLNQIY